MNLKMKKINNKDASKEVMLNQVLDQNRALFDWIWLLFAVAVER